MKKKKILLISICAVLIIAGLAIVAAAVMNGNPQSVSTSDGCTVTFDLCTDLETSNVLEKTVSPGSFLEEPEVYVLEDNEENWEIAGWYREPEYEHQWDFDFDTVEEDITLYAEWGTNIKCVVSFYTEESEEPVTSITLNKGLTVAPCDDKFTGREVLGYYTDKEMKQEFNFDTKIESDMDIWVDISDYIYFTGKEIAKWNLCGNQAEAQEYESVVSTSGDTDYLTISTKHGGYLWLKDMALNMNGTSIIEVKMREVNGEYNGNFGGYVCGSYEIDGEPGINGDFGQDHTGPMFYSRSEEPDEDGFYTYTCNISSLTPGLQYTELNGLRIDFWDADEDRNTFVYELKDLKSYVDPYAVSGEAFRGNGIDFNALHLNTFLSMGNATTEMLSTTEFRFGGPHGANIYKKELEISMGEEQIIELKAKGDLKDGQIVMYLYGDYTQDGKAGSLDDFAEKHKIFFTPGTTDAAGYTTYTAYIGSISGLKYKTIRGLRMDLYGDGTRTIDITSMKSRVPTQAELDVYQGFTTNGINFNALHLNTFLAMGNAVTELLSETEFRFGGPHGAYIYKKELQINMGEEQMLELKAKGDLNGGQIVMYLYGDYTQDGAAGSLEDFGEEHKLFFTPGTTDADGYTTYTAYIGSVSGLKYNTIRGIRIDLYGDGTRTIDIASLKSKVPSQEELELYQAFSGNGLNLTGAHFAQFIQAGEPEYAELQSNGDYRFGGEHGVFLYKKDMNVTIGNQQRIQLKVKGDLNNGLIALYLYGEYTMDGEKAVNDDFTAEHRWDFTRGATDEEGYTTYTVDITGIAGLTYDVIHGFRIDLYGDGERTIDIKSAKSMEIPEEEAALDKDFAAKKLSFTGAHFTKFGFMGNGETSLLENGDFRFGGEHGVFLYKKDMKITLGDQQRIQLKVKGDLNNGLIALYLYGEYTMNGKKAVNDDFTAEHRWDFSKGETDKYGYTTYTVDISSIPGLKYNVINGFRIDLYGEGERTIDIKSVKSMEIPKEEAALDKAFSAKAINLTGAHLTKFTAMGDLTTKLLSNGDFCMSGTHGAFIHRKNLSVALNKNKQTIEIKAKGKLNGGAIGLYIYGDYTIDGKKGSTDDYNADQYWTMTAGATDKSGYTTYTVTLSDKYPGLIYKTIKGLRIELWGEQAMSLDIKSIKNVKTKKTSDTNKPSDTNKNNFLYLSADDLSMFYGIGATIEWNADNTAVKVNGANGAFIHMMDLNYNMPAAQTIEMKAKVSKGTRVGVYMFGDYTQNGKAGSTTDYGAHVWTMTAGQTDTDGYTTFTLNVEDGYPGLVYNKVKGFRIDLWDGSDNTLEIKYVKALETRPAEQITVNYYVNGTKVLFQSVESGAAATEPTEKQLGIQSGKIFGYYTDAEMTKKFDFSTKITKSLNIYVDVRNYLYLSADDLAAFYGVGAITSWNKDNTALCMTGGNGAFIHMTEMKYLVPDTQQLEMKARVSDDTNVIVYLRGTYTKDGKTETIADYSADFWWQMIPGETDAEGYTTYTLDLSAGHEGYSFQTIEGFRLEIQGGSDIWAEVKYIMSTMVETDMLTVNYYVDGTAAYSQQVKPGMPAVKPTDAQLGVTGKRVVGYYSDEDCTVPFNFSTPLTTKMNVYVKTQAYLNLSASDLSMFYSLLGASIEWNTDNTAVIVSGGHGAFIHMINMNSAVAESQKIQMKAKVSEGTTIIVYIRGTYMKDGNLVTISDYTGEQYWAMKASETDADGYTAYTIDLTDNHPGCEYLSIEGYRIELQNSDTYSGAHTAEIKEVTTVVE